MYEKLDKCPLCHSAKISNFLICKDHLVSGESFAVNICENCSLQFTNPRPDETVIGHYYKSDNYISHTNKGNNLLNIAYKAARKFTLRNKLRIVNRYAKQGHMLDVGCGTGEFLHTCRQNGWKITGVEPDETARGQATRLTGTEIYDKLKNLPPDIKYNVITLWHVFEHMADMHKTIKKLKKVLKRKGRLLIAVPNVKSYDAGKYKEFWAAYDVPRHFYHFNQESFKILAKEHNLVLQEILPMKLDSYYISMLSEKYMNHRMNLTNSIISGLKSNSYAKKNKNNYSSLIYILKK